MAAVAGPLPLSWQSGATGIGIFSEFATGDYFKLLGIAPYRGRFFGAQEDAAGTFTPVVVISFQCWRSRFGADENILGRTLRLNGQGFAVIGVAPAGFSGLHTFFGPEMWLPSRAAPLVLGDAGKAWIEDRAQPVFNVFGRLKSGVARQTAQADLRAVAGGLTKEFPTINRDASVSVRPVNEATVFPGLGSTGFGAGILLMAVVGAILLIACSNVANLLLARAVNRRHEIAMRAALGASRIRIVRQLLTESMLLGFIGGAIGLALAEQLRAVLWTFRPAIVAGSLIEPQLDWRVLLFGIMASLIAGLLFGLAPAIEASRTSIISTVRDESGSVTTTKWCSRLSDLLLSGQVALCVLCLIVAAIILRNIQALYSSDPGFDTQHLAMVSASPQQVGYSDARATEYYRDVRQALTRETQVESLTWANTYPLFGGPSRAVSVQRDTQIGKPRTSQVNVVDLDYFRTVGLPLLSGRDFNSQDRAGSVPVVIVNQAFANDIHLGGAVAGLRIRLSGETVDRQIIAISKTSVLTFLGEPPQPCIYIPLAQSPQSSMV
jgi:predicted permease